MVTTAGTDTEWGSDEEDKLAPAMFPNVISVASLDEDMTTPFISNYNKKVS